MRCWCELNARTPTLAPESPRRVAPVVQPVSPVGAKLLALQSTAGNRAVGALVARQPTKQAPAATRTVTFPWGEAKTYAELAAGLKRAAAHIDGEIGELGSGAF